MTFQQIGLPASVVMARIVELRKREDRRVDALIAEAKEDGLPAIDVALTAAGAVADHSAGIALFKQRVLNAIRLGAGHPTVRARYGRRAAQLRHYSLNAAIYLTDKWLREEKRKFSLGSAIYGGGNRLSVEVLKEMCLLLRLLRRSKYHSYLPGIIAFVLGASAENDVAR